jgi:transcriptional regulator with XRE-family HTH domain
MIACNQLAHGRLLANISRRSLASLCLMSVGTLAAVEAGEAHETNPTAVERVQKTLELNGIRFTAEGAVRV